RCLEERIFGPLLPDVIAAIARHDFGWDESDERQLKALPDAVPRPFPALDTEETLPSWSKSIALAAAVSPLVEVLVSRHFCLLGAGEPSRTGFVRAETARREAIERALPFPQADLDRWTGALGFCDLLSLYLCAGCTTPAEFPLAHPASPNAGMAPKTVLTWRSGSPVLSPPALKPATEVALSLRLYTRDGASQASESLAWSFGKHGFFQQQGT
ncbi:MAG: DUF3891 family protein, partial [Acidobacteriaceae bacterium]|nr:DUF3891 family protein [Acidobacteriaceae bacterium]